jgi:hypothetical protein
MDLLLASELVYTKLFPQFKDYLAKELSDCETLLDIGCGKKSPIQFSSVSYSVGVDMFRPYLLESKKKKIHNSYVRSDIRKVEFKEKSFDCVTCLDVLEHLEKDESFKLIEKMQNWAKKKLILLLPNGFPLQDEYDGNPLQIHKSGWSVDELEPFGVKIYGINGLKFLRGECSELKFKPKVFWRLISDFTQRATYLRPNCAYQLFCIKHLNVTI